VVIGIVRIPKILCDCVGVLYLPKGRNCELKVLKRKISIGSCLWPCCLENSMTWLGFIYIFFLFYVLTVLYNLYSVNCFSDFVFLADSLKWNQKRESNLQNQLLLRVVLCNNKWKIIKFCDYYLSIKVPANKWEK